MVASASSRWLWCQRSLSMKLFLLMMLVLWGSQSYRLRKLRKAVQENSPRALPEPTPTGDLDIAATLDLLSSFDLRLEDYALRNAKQFLGVSKLVIDFQSELHSLVGELRSRYKSRHSPHLAWLLQQIVSIISEGDWALEFPHDSLSRITAPEYQLLMAELNNRQQFAEKVSDLRVLVRQFYERIAQESDPYR